MNNERWRIKENRITTEHTEIKEKGKEKISEKWIVKENTGLSGQAR